MTGLEQQVIHTHLQRERGQIHRRTGQEQIHRKTGQKQGQIHRKTEQGKIHGTTELETHAGRVHELVVFHILYLVLDRKEQEQRQGQLHMKVLEHHRKVLEHHKQV